VVSLKTAKADSADRRAYRPRWKAASRITSGLSRESSACRDKMLFRLIDGPARPHNALMRSDFLFAMPSWLTGVARTLDLAGQFDEYNDSGTEGLADAKALFCDWRAIGDALRDAMKAFVLEPQKPTPAE
jgi:hypothetical protein